MDEMERKMTNIGSGSGRRDNAGQTDWKKELAQELREALAKGSDIDYEQWRAEVDGNLDHSPKDWWAWAESTDRHIRRGALERE